MKKIYWRPKHISRTVVALIACFSIAGLFAVEFFQTKAPQPYYAEKLAAARLAKQAMEAIKQEKIKLYGELDLESDPAQSGMIGTLMSQVTSNTGHLEAKQTSLNPNFAAVMVHLLKRAGVEEGDLVAVGFSGSFPALNIATYAALEVLKAKPLAISSVTASQWGANLPDLLWVDMESVLHKRKIFSYKSHAASLGGIEDRGLGLSRMGRNLLQDGITRNNLVFIKTKTLNESVDTRMQLYQELAQGDEIKAYVNVGGGSSSVGTSISKKAFAPGLNRTMPAGASNVNSVMTRFMEEGVPVIHLVQIDHLATRYGLPHAPQTMPIPGEGKIFVREGYNRIMTAMILIFILFFLYAFVRSDWGFRFMHSSNNKSQSSHPEQMV